MEPTSPKGHDLRRDGRYALHCGVSDTNGTSGEFSLKGQAQLIDNPETRVLAVQLAPYSPAERYILFELSLESAASTVYEGDRIIRLHWQRELP